MEMKFAQCVNKGMQRDYSMNTASQEFAYENKNIRITTTGNESFLSITNEKSTVYNSVLMAHLQTYESILDYKYNADNIRVEDLTITFNFYDGTAEKEEPLKKDTTFRIYDNYEGSNEYVEIIVPKGVTTFTITGWDIQNLQFGKGVEIVQIDNKELYNIADDVPVNMGTILGVTTIGEYVIVFSKYEDSSEDVIYRLKEFDAEVWLAETVFRGNLNFDINHPIECTTSYESEDVQKVYWVDGINQPRIINICELGQSNYTTNLDFVPKIEGDIKVSVEKQYEGRGVFPSGVIQYYVTYYNKFGQESNAVHVTPLYSLSPSDRGGAEDETQTCSFKIHIENVDTHYDNIRIYSFIRTSLNATPIVSIVGDLEINKENSEQYYEIVDDNYGNINVASSDILFLGGNTISASTIEQKDNTLFLGNISSIVNNDDYTELKEVLENNRSDGEEDGLSFVSRPIANKKAINDDYGYAPNMDNSSKDRGFKYLEWYRFGLQFQSDTGEWGNTLWLNDKQNPLRPNIIQYDEEDTIIQEMYDKADNFHSLAAVKFKPTDAIKDIISNYNSKYYRLVMAEHNDLSRTIKTQGIVMPTVFNLKQRCNNSVFGAPAWSYGLLNNKKHLSNVDLFTASYEDVLHVNPTQQLDSSLYNISDHSNTEEGFISFKYLPTASLKTEEVENSNEFYLKKIKVIIAVFRGTLDQIQAGKAPGIDPSDYFSTPQGSLIQDFFQIKIIPYKQRYGTEEEIEMDSIRFSDYALAGKRRNRIESLILNTVSKTWKDVGITDLDYAFPNEHIITAEELWTVDAIMENCKSGKDWSDYKFLHKNGSTVTTINDYLKNHQNEYFVDANLCNLWCPNIEFIEEGNFKVRIIGNNNILNTISDYDIVVENNVVQSKSYEYLKTNFNHFKWSESYSNREHKDFNIGISSFPLWQGINNLIWVYPWNQGGYLDGEHFNIKNKTFGNFWKCDTIFTDKEHIIDYGNLSIKKITEDVSYIDGSLYYSKYQNVLFPKFLQRVCLRDTSVVLNSSLNEIVEQIDDTNYMLAEEDTNTNVNIKYSATPHITFKLPLKFGYKEVLPSYRQFNNNPYEDKNFSISENITYPINTIYADYLLTCSLESTESVENLLNALKDNTIFHYTINPNMSNSKTLSFYKDDIRNSISFSRVALSKDALSSISISDVSLPKKQIVFYPQHKSDLFKDDLFYLDFKEDDIVHIKKLNNNLVSLNVNGKTKYVILQYNKNEGSYIVDTFNSKLTTLPHYTNFSNDTLYDSNSNSFIAELYIDYDPSTFMGGNTENALELNTFIPISDPTPIGDIIYGFEGDTYYQQWDCLRIYPTSEDDVNKVVDVVSVPIETYTNLDGDTRKARGRADVINIRPDNIMNQINSVYSQSNNYITSNILDKKSEDSTHPLQYWWSLTKTPNADIDTWTGVNLTSVAELDGDKGSLNKIKRWNNQLFAFQDKAIAMINYNNQTTIATQEGLPVEISNSGKVQGHYYLTTNNGCKNKWSIVESPNGLYFIDSYNKSINVIGDGIKSLSQLNLFQDWIEQKERGNIWNSTRNLQAFKGFYDPIHKEVYFADGEDCICYNELLQQFTSFYDYQNMNYMFALDNHIYSIPTDSSLYTMFEGNDYCKLFDKQCDYYMQYKINNEPFIDKTWTNLEYRADIFDRGNIQTNEFDTNDIVNNETFDLLKVWNEYQNGELDLTKVRFGYLKEAKPKFRIWRTNLPRAKSTTSNKFGLDRIRNPWIMLELKKTGDTSKRMEFHDLVIKYVI